MSTTEENIRKLFVLKKLYNQTFNKDEKTLAGYVVFAKALYQRDFTSQQELSDCCGCNKAHTSRTLLKMQKCGYVALKKEEDEKKISLTPAGRQFAQKAIKQEKDILDKLSEDVDSQDLQTFNKVVGQLIDKAEQLIKSARSEV
ncbi:MAG: hypothetical protein IJX00_03835 [Clostridia bacterium]|nr:hypothetical protein [Clostridia bacterium]